jgi:RNA polymerase sigma factor (sigma-70 family)
LAELDLAALVRAAADGDAGAWDRLVERCSPLLWSIARGYRLSTADAEDVVQTSWLRLLEHLGRLTDPGRVTAWLATTVRRECLLVLRKQGRTVPTGPDELEADAGADQGVGPEAALLRSERSVLLARAFAELSARCQQLLRLLAAEASYDEVVAATGMPIGGIGPTRARCLDRLRRRLAVAGSNAGLAD